MRGEIDIMFMSSDKREVGMIVKLKKPIETLSGTFTEGHIFKAIGYGCRGYDYIDKDGNKLLETCLNNFEEYFEIVQNDEKCIGCKKKIPSTSYTIHITREENL